MVIDGNPEPRSESELGISSIRAYLWDHDIDEDQFRSILAGELVLGRLDRDWAAMRLIEYAPYTDIVHMIGFGGLVRDWPRWRDRVRSQSRKRGLDFLVEWLPQHHPEWL